MSDISDVITSPSARTIAERAKLAHGIDDFASFKWAGVDMWQSFGAFIINEKKGSLKFYNGPSYSNTYTKQQFMDGYTNISGITFDTQKISFTIGVYWISIEDYRLLINLLHPYEVNYLNFSFEPNYCYQCKLEAIKDSTRHIVGKEVYIVETPTSGESPAKALNYTHLMPGEQDKEGYRYYTELSLTFDVVGPSCAVSNTVYTQTSTFNASTSSAMIYLNNTENSSTALAKNIIKSDLDYPFILDIKGLNFVQNAAGNYSIQAVINYAGDSKILFDIKFKNLPADTTFNLTYNSEHGLVSMRVGDKLQIITLLTTLTTGARIIDALTVNRCFMPGRFSFPNLGNNVATITVQGNGLNNPTSIECTATSRTRTNVI